MEGFKLSDSVDKNTVFIVMRSELEGRFDATFYFDRPNFNGTIKLSKVAKVRGGKRIPLGYDYSIVETKTLYLRVANMDENEDFKYSEFKFISDELYQLLKRYEVFENELIISIAGTVGKTKVLKGIPFDKKVILTENCAKLVVNEGIVTEYLNLILQTSFLQKQISLSYIQTTIPKLGIDKILELRIPAIPAIKKQLEIVSFYNQAYFQKQQKEAQAQALLESIDDYLLGELGITLPSENEEQSNLSLAAEPKVGYGKSSGFELDKKNLLVKKGRLFLTGFRDIVGQRIDPDYTKKISCLLQEKGKYPNILFKEMLIKRPQYGANEEAIEYETKNEVRYIRITDIDNVGNLKNDGKKTALTVENKYLLNKNDLLFARSGSVGRCYIHKNTREKAIFAGYLIRFVVDVKKYNPDYIFYYCNSKLYRYWVSAIERPAVQSNINSEEYKSLPIPLPPLIVQNQIADKIKKIRQKANELQQAAADILESAKRKVERMILRD